jgi:hypothetical protein
MVPDVTVGTGIEFNKRPVRGGFGGMCDRTERQNGSLPSAQRLFPSAGLGDDGSVMVGVKAGPTEASAEK